MQCFKHGDAIALFPGHSILQPWRKIDFSPRLQDKIWEWPGNEDSNAIEMHNRISFDFDLMDKSLIEACSLVKVIELC